MRRMLTQILALAGGLALAALRPLAFILLLALLAR